MLENHALMAFKILYTGSSPKGEILVMYNHDVRFSIWNFYRRSF